MIKEEKKTSQAPVLRRIRSNLWIRKYNHPEILWKSAWLRASQVRGVWILRDHRCVCASIYFSTELRNSLLIDWTESREYQWEMQLLDQATTPKTTPANLEATSPVDGSPNKISESILKCLINIYLRLSSMKNRNSTESLPSQTVAYSFDPYNLCSMFGKRDIGPYKHLMTIEAASIDPNRTTISVFLVQRLKWV